MRIYANFTQNEKSISNQSNSIPQSKSIIQSVSHHWTAHSTTIVIVIMYVCNANVDEELTELNHCRSPLAAMQSCF